MLEKSIAIIPARAGSKRVVDKNIREVSGKPLIAWTIKAAIESQKFDRIIVSTDDKKIANIAMSHGAEVPFLRDKYADEISSSSEATLYALNQAEEYWGEEYSIVCQLMATCPIRSSNDIDEAVVNFKKVAAKSQLSCCSFGWVNPMWAVSLDRVSRPTPKFPEALKARSQDLPELYCPTGAIWLSRRDELVKHRTFYSPEHTFYPIPFFSALDIDTEDDLLMAEQLLSVSRSISN